MENLHNEAEQVLKKYLVTLKPQQTHIVPLDHLLRKVNWSKSQENMGRLKEMISKNCPSGVRVNLI